MADTDIPSSSESSIDDGNHPISKACKKAKMAETSTTTITRDFISRLPDAILCDILSYIPTKHAVATSVLSKRWNQVWTSVPNLDLIDRWWYEPHTPVYKTHFINFVIRVLSLNNLSSVRKIYVRCNDDFDYSHVNSLISGVRMRHTEEFDITLPRSCLIENLDQSSRIQLLPDSFFTRNNLVRLSLKNIPLKVPKSVYFPSLKTIRFDAVQLLDDDSLKNLLSGCPVLLKLTISRSRGTWDNAQTLYISSTTLDNLSLHTEYCKKDFGYKVVIDAPSLRTLNLTDEVDADYDIINLSSLVEALVGVQLDERGRVQTNEEVFNVRLFELLRKVSHVEDMCFAVRTMQSFTNALLENVPIFYNLTRMKVELLYSSWWSILPYLFHCAPNLVTLVLDQDDVHPDCCWYPPNVVPQCFLSTLENVEIDCIKECDEELEMIYYFLKNAMVLKKLSIISLNLELEKETNLLEQLLIMPRSSSICQIEYKNLRC